MMTDIEKFDRAVFKYLTTISPKIIYSSTKNAIRNITKKEKFSDTKPWNFISFYRNPTFGIDWERMNNPATIRGDQVRLIESSQGRSARYVQHVPVELDYNIDIWASKSTEVLSLATALITKLFMQEQVLFVPLNPDGELGRFHMIDISWEDDSDLERETEIGKIYRHTISFTVEAAIIMSTDIDTTEFCSVPADIYE